jgi:hypothetical protein
MESSYFINGEDGETMNGGEKQEKTFPTNDEAVAGIIVAVMIVGLVISVLAIIQTVYVPQWMIEREAEHMMVVSDQISQIKYTLDSMAVTQKETPVSAFVTLGSKELGFFSSARSYGYLQYLKDGFKLQFDTGGITQTEEFNILYFTSENSYYLDQKYTLEAGALILSQDSGTVMLNPPSMSIDKEKLSSVDGILITILPINLQIVGGVSSLGGYGAYPIQLTYDTNDSALIGDPENIVNDHVDIITITSTERDSWKEYFDRFLTENGLTRGVNPDDDYSFTDISDNQVAISFDIWESGNKYVIIKLETSYVNLQMAPGWI